MRIYLLSALFFVFSWNNFHAVGSYQHIFKYKEDPRLLEVSVDESMAEMDACAGHGTTVAVGISWNIATCKSNCNRGLGFRCGSETFVRCSDGSTIVTGSRGGGCPDAIIQAERNISAGINYYDNNTIKFIFLSALPDEERDNNTFEVEDDVTLNLPGYLLIDGKHYQSFTLKKGTYEVDRADGEFGTVTIDISLNNK